MKIGHQDVQQIEIRIAELSALFNSMDPTPFHHRDLDRDAVEFLEKWALEFSRGSQFCITVHLEQMPPLDPSPLLGEAIRNYFDYKSTLAQRNLRLLFMEGRTSLVIGVGFLTICLLGADLLTAFATNTFSKMVKESLLIGGWVAMWRPMQIFLYDWWPIVRKRRIYSNLGAATVRVLQAEPQCAAHPAASR